MQAERRGLRAMLLGKGDLGEEVVAAPPHPPHPLEGRAVLVAGGGQCGVQLGGLHSGGLGRGPDVEAPRRGGTARGDGAGGMAGPRPAGAPVVPPGVDGDRPAAGHVRCADHHPELDGALLRKDQRRLQGELLQQAAAHLVTRTDRQLDQRRAGYNGALGHPVVGQPVVGRCRKAPGEQHRLGVGELHGRAQQGCSVAAAPTAGAAPASCGSSGGRISSVRIVALTLRRSQHIGEWGSGIGATRAARAPPAPSRPHFRCPAQLRARRNALASAGQRPTPPAHDREKRLPVRHQYLQCDGGRFPRTCPAALLRSAIMWKGSSRVLRRRSGQGHGGSPPRLYGNS